uniref:Fe2OG dioxygenase domain-containing protein n=1 Tax=Setaria viridis TaxID=4556 RepID=A0A4V6DDF9_SETVI|nr:hypothetical protein SEVIR_3G369700v2 [Setaria viridis]
MENMIHSTVPHVPPVTSVVVSLPVIDMSCSRDEVCRAILDAGKELGFFQAGDGVMQDMAAVGEEFLRLPAADKVDLFSEDVNKATRLFSGTTYETGGERYWRDCLRFAYDFPVGNSTKDWPDKPQRLREVVENFTLLARGLAMELNLSGGYVTLDINHYPPCPNPSITLGLPPHCDRDLIAILVKPVPHAFIVNFGQQLEVVTNGMLKSIEHRVMTNSALARTSVAMSIAPTENCVIGPAEEFPFTMFMVPGLEVACKGDWIKVKPLPQAFVVNFGQQLEVVTNGLLKSIEHRVTTNSARARTSVCKRIYNVVKLGESLNLTTNLKDVQKEV